MAKTIVGTVTSDVQDKTIVVSATHRETHPIYGKQYTVTKKFAAHDEDNKAHVGDKVEIVETRPISKNKSFKLASIIETGHAAIELKEEAVLAPKSEQTPEASSKPKEAKKEKASSAKQESEVS